MILVDSGVWIDYFRGAQSDSTDALDGLLGSEGLLIGDLILTEVLQGFLDDSSFARARSLLSAFPLVIIGGEEVAIAAAHFYRALRRRAVTVRKTVDTLIATRCILDGHQLLFNDRDFLPFVEHCGLKSALSE
jgi:predicted nucleic acid-binding protein